MKKYLSVILAIIITVSCTATAFASDGNGALPNSISISKNDSRYKISNKLYGAFIEDISYSCDGGLVSNLINNNSFEYEFNNTSAWKCDREISVDNKFPMNKNNLTYASLKVEGNLNLTNMGVAELYDYKTWDINEKKKNTADIGYRENVEYDFSCYLRTDDFKGTVSVFLDSPKNKNNIVELDTSSVGTVWTKVSATLTSVANEDGAFTISFKGNGTIDIDFVSLIPKNSYGYGTEDWKYTSLRSDLFQAINQMAPKFIRFPGGCLAEGDSLDNLYNWKDTIGPVEERPQTYNLWRDDYGRDYINTNAMGYHEYFQLCDDVGAEPLPILNVGLTCQGRCAYDDHVIALEKSSMTDDEWQDYLTNVRNYAADDTQGREDFTNYINGFNINSREDFEKWLDTIALRPNTAEWDAYVQDIKDLIQYANGDPNTSYWGSLRAANGSVDPFNLKYIGLGNENWGEIYERNFKALYKEIKKEYPEITIISSSGAWLEGEAFDNNWEWINDGYTDTIVDEHYYTIGGYLFDHNDRYDNYDRSKAHVFIGEYAATADGVGTLQTKSNIYEAVEEASYLTGIERNGDVVEMASFAPTFAKLNDQCWSINLLWFDSQELIATPSYYTQMLFSNNVGTKYIESTFENQQNESNGIYQSTTIDEKNQIIYVKLVNSGGKKQDVHISLDGYSANRVSAQTINSSFKSACNELGKNTTYPTEYDLNTTDNNITVGLNKYDITVVRIAYGDNDGSSLYTLPPFIDTVEQNTSNYLPPAVRVAIPCIIGAVILAGALTIVIVKIIDGKRAKKRTEEE